MFLQSTTRLSADLCWTLRILENIYTLPDPSGMPLILIYEEGGGLGIVGYHRVRIQATK